MPVHYFVEKNQENIIRSVNRSLTLFKVEHLHMCLWS